HANDRGSASACGPRTVNCSRPAVAASVQVAVIVSAKEFSAKAPVTRRFDVAHVVAPTLPLEAVTDRPTVLLETVAPAARIWRISSTRAVPSDESGGWLSTATAATTARW